MKNKKIAVGIISLISALTLAGCGGNNENTSPKEETTQNEETKMDHSSMEHSSSGEVPEGLKVAENPTYKVGSKAIIKEGHMEGMKGAEAKSIVAFAPSMPSICSALVVISVPGFNSSSPASGISS